MCGAKRCKHFVAVAVGIGELLGKFAERRFARSQEILHIQHMTGIPLGRRVEELCDSGLLLL